MAKVSDYKKADTSHDTVLSYQMKRLRLRVLKTVKSKTLDEALEALRAQLPTEKDATARLGLLAAKTWLIRQKILYIGKAEPKSVADDIALLEPSSKQPKAQSLTEAAQNHDATGENSTAPQSWKKVKILEETVVNGMRFFKDFVIEVNIEDAQRLVDAGKAVVVEQLDQASKPETSKPTSKTSKE